MGPACKVIINNGVRAVVDTTNDLLRDQMTGGPEYFSQDSIEAMVSLDLAYLAAKHLVQVDNKAAFNAVYAFNLAISKIAADVAAQRYDAQ